MKQIPFNKLKVKWNDELIKHSCSMCKIEVSQNVYLKYNTLCYYCFKMVMKK